MRLKHISCRFSKLLNFEVAATQLPYGGLMYVKRKMIAFEFGSL